MLKRTFSVAFASLIAVSAMTSIASADIKKGQKYYLKDCKVCHGNGTKGAAMLDQDEWLEMFANDAEEMKAVHIDSGDERAKQYIESQKFEKHAPHLKDFLHEYGADSGNVPACG
jgi:mono/diheme cytochrome c family protein